MGPKECANNLECSRNVCLRGGVTFKALSVAAIAGCAIIGCAQSAYADTFTSYPELDSGSINVDFNKLIPALDGSGFAYGRNEVSPDSEQNEVTGATLRNRNFVSVEQIQDRGSEGEGVNTAQVHNQTDRLRVGARSDVGLAFQRHCEDFTTGFAADLELGTPEADALLQDKPISTPTLDYLKNNNYAVPGALKFDKVIDVFTHTFIDNDGNKHTVYSINGIEDNPNAYQEFLASNKGVFYRTNDGGIYTFSEFDVTTLEDAIEKFKEGSYNYERYGSYIQLDDPKLAYDEYYKKLPASSFTDPVTDYKSAYTITSGTAGDHSFEYKTADKDGNITSSYYTIDLKSPPLEGWDTGVGSASSSDSHVTWKKVPAPAEGTDLPANTIKIDFPTGAKYYQYTYNQPKSYTNVTERINDTLTSENVTNKVFHGMTTDSNGGAIYNTQNKSTVDIIADFINNSATTDDHYFNSSYGGAICNKVESDGISAIGNITGDFVNNSANYHGGAIYNAAGDGAIATIENITGVFINNTAYYGGAIYNNCSYYGGPAQIRNITGDFINNSANYHGSAIYNEGTIGDITGNFINNSADYIGGAVYNRGTINKIIGNFLKNTGGAIHNEDKICDITGDFVENTGGAIYNSGIIGNISGLFANNKSLLCSERYGIIDNNRIIANITGEFINNTGTSIGNYVNGYVGNIVGDFINNSTTNLGGAIANTNGTSHPVMSGSRISNIVGTFIGNRATALTMSNGQSFGEYGMYNVEGRGGAIYNEAEIDNISATFIGNKASVSGGAIFSAAKTSIIKGEFIDNSVEAYGENVYSVSGGAICFSDSNWDYGGAVAVMPEKINANFIENYAQSEKSAYGGAISVEGHTGFLNVENSNFVGNKTVSTESEAEGGAIYINDEYYSNISSARLLNTNFINNYADGKTDAKGGAIYSKKNLEIIADNGVSNFSGNYILNNGLRDNQAIYLAPYSSSYSAATKVPTISFIAKNNGRIVMNDKITGDFIPNVLSIHRTESEPDIIYDKEGNVVQKFISSSFKPYVAHVFDKNNQEIRTIRHDYNSWYGGPYNVYDENFKIIKEGNFDRKNLDAYILKFFDTDGSVKQNLNYSNKQIDYQDGVGKYEYNIYDDLYNVTKTGQYKESSAWNNSVNKTVYTRTYLDDEGNQTETIKYSRDYSNGKDTYTIYNDDFSVKETGAYKRQSKNVYNSNILDKDGNVLKSFKYSSERDDSGDYYQIYDGDGTAIRNESKSFYTVNVYNGKDEIVDTVRYTQEDNRDEDGKYIYTYHILDENYKEKEVYTSYNRDFVLSGYFDLYRYDETVTLKIDGDATGQVIINDTVDAKDSDGNQRPADISLANTNLYLGRENVFDGNNLALNSGFMSMINGTVGVSSLNSMTVNGDTNFAADVNLETQTMDRFVAQNYGQHNGKLNVVGMNILKDAPQDRPITAVYFAQPGLKDYVVNALGELPNSKYQTQVYTPIYKYNVIYDKDNQYNDQGDGGYFVFSKGDVIVKPPKPDEPNPPIVPTPGGNTGNPSDAFNPAVLTAPVSTVAASQATMNEVFKYVFEHADAFTQLPETVRLTKLQVNRFALGSTDFNSNLNPFKYDMGSLEHEVDKAAWVRPYATFEDINMKNGPAVDAVSYGSIIGYDGEFKPMRRGWHRMGTSYLGYHGSNLHYAGNSTTTNGGLLGLTETFYKGNFWTALTASAGASVGETNTMYGKEDYTSLMAGVASKTGYNFEFKEGRYIVQPIMYMSYTFVNTFDYTNAAGVKIDTKPAHSIMLHPSLRFVMNCKNGYQPYVQAGVVWNVLNQAHITANGVRLPNMKMEPYAEYGVGVQRNWDEKYTAFLQAMVRNGGRTGIAFTAGFRWVLGRKEANGKNEKVQITPGSRQANAQAPTKTVLKQLSPAQKTALGKRQNTTRITSAAVLRAL